MPAALARVNREHGTGFRLVRSLAGGYQNGAWLVVDPNRGPAVLKIADGPTGAAGIRRAAPVVTAARAAGWPTPDWLFSGATEAGAGYVLQAYVPGEARETITDEWLDAVLPLVDRQAGLAVAGATDHADLDHEIVFANGEGSAAAVSAAGAEGAGFVGVAAELTGPYAGVRLSDDDLVHGDLNPGNVLWHGGTVVAVVDVESIGRGSRLHDLATLAAYAWLWGDRAAVPRILSHARSFAAPGELEISLVAVLLGLYAFGTRHWSRADFMIMAATGTSMLRSVF